MYQHRMDMYNYINISTYNWYNWYMYMDISYVSHYMIYQVSSKFTSYGLESHSCWWEKPRNARHGAWFWDVFRCFSVTAKMIVVNHAQEIEFAVFQHPWWSELVLSKGQLLQRMYAYTVCGDRVLKFLMIHFIQDAIVVVIVLAIELLQYLTCVGCDHTDSRSILSITQYVLPSAIPILQWADTHYCQPLISIDDW